MKKLVTLVFALLLGASLSFAQTAADTSKKSDDSKKSEKKEKKAKKAKKSKKGDKGADATSTPK